MNLTAQTLLDMRDRIFPPMVYAVHEQVEAGKVYQMKASDISPEFFIFHSQEEAQQIAKACGCRLIHVRDYHRHRYPGAHDDVDWEAVRDRIHLFYPRG